MKLYWKKMMMIMLALALVLSGCGGGTDKESTAGAETTESATEEAETLAPPIAIDDISEYVTLGQYLGIEAEKPSTEVTDKEIEDAIESVLDYYSDYEQIKEGVVADGDTVGIDYVGKLDGVAFEGGTGSYDLEIGSGSFIDGFEEGLIGVKIGETVDLNLTFPDPYKNNPDLAGKAVVFTVTVNYKLGTEKVRPEFDDELAKQLEYENAEEMREELIKSLKEQKESEAENNYIIAIWDTVIGNCEVKKHDDLYNEYYGNFLAQYEDMASMYGMELQKFIENYYGLKYEEFISYAEEYATSCMNQDLVCRAIAEKEEMVVTDEEYAETLKEYYTQYSTYFANEAELETYYGKDRLTNDILLQRSIDLVIDNAVAVEPSEEATTGEASEETTAAAEEGNTGASTEAE